MKKLEFNKLKKTWYAKLKKSGFEDIETDEDNLKVWSSDMFGPKKALVQNGGWQAKASYYQMAGYFLAEYKFESKIDAVIWEYHSNGISVRDITQMLRKARIKRTSRDSVWRIIKKLKAKMYDLYMSQKEPYRE